MTNRDVFPSLDGTQLITATGGQAINFNDTQAAIDQVRKRAEVCRGLNAETLRLSGGREPRPGTDAYAMAAATRACWASIGNGGNPPRGGGR